MRLVRILVETFLFVSFFILIFPLFIVFIGSWVWFSWVEEWIKEEWEQ